MLHFTHIKWMASICCHQIGVLLFVHDYPFDPMAIKVLQIKSKFASTTISSSWQRGRSLVDLKDPFPRHAGPIDSSPTFTYDWDLVTWFDLNSFVHLCCNCTDTGKHRRNREVITQTPASDLASQEDNSLGYKGTGQKSFLSAMIWVALIALTMIHSREARQAWLQSSPGCH